MIAPKFPRPRLLLVSVLCIAGCVKVSGPPPERGIRINPGPMTTQDVAARPPGATTVPGSTEPITLPPGPLAKPVSPDASVSSQVTMAFADLGAIPYDGVVLPLISPDGRFAATQTGDPTPWPVLLAQPGARSAPGVRIAAYSLKETNSPKDPALQLIPWSAELPAGLILGRSCDSTGFLVEAIQPSGSRWIGKVSWLSGTVAWLAQGDTVCAHAALGPSGELAFMRRSGDSATADLVLRVPSRSGEVVLSNPGVSYDYPIFTDEPGIVYVFSRSSQGLDVHAVSLPKTGGFAGISISATHHLLDRADEVSAYQAAAPVQTPFPRAGVVGGAGKPRTELLFMHPSWGVIGVFDWKTSSIYPLSKGAVAAVPFSDAEKRGFLTTTKHGLAFERAHESGPVPAGSVRAEPVSIVAEPLLPRLTTDEKWPYLLIGPAQDIGQARLELYRMGPGGTGP
jgi:hypothetical protein